MTIISTGSRSINELLGGGIRTGLVTDIFGTSKYARNALSHSICINAARIFSDSIVIFVDTQGNFRPEIVLNYLVNTKEPSEILKRIVVVRLYSTRLFSTVIRKSILHSPQLILIDNFISLFSSEFHGITKHLSVMHHLRELAKAALDHDVATVITNPSVYQRAYQYPLKESTAFKRVAYGRNLLYEEEMLGMTLSMHTSTVLKLERSEVKDSVYSVQLVKPARNSKCFIRIVKGQIYEFKQG